MSLPNIEPANQFIVTVDTIVDKVCSGHTYVALTDYIIHLNSITGTQAFDEGGITELADWTTYHGVPYTYTEITAYCSKICINRTENAIDDATLEITNDVSIAGYPQTYVKMGNLIRITSEASITYQRTFQGIIVDLKPSQSCSDGSLFTVMMYAYPAIGLSRMLVNNEYSEISLRGVLADGQSFNLSLFPYFEWYTESCNTSVDWKLFGNNPHSISLVNNDGTHGVPTSPVAGSSKVIKLYYSSGITLLNGNENARFGGISGSTYWDSVFGSVGGLNIDLLSNPLYDTTNELWYYIPAVDFYIYRHHSGSGQYNVELQIRNNDFDYMYMGLTDDPASDLYGIDLIPDDGNWHHLVIPVGSKWGMSLITLDDDVTPTYLTNPSLNTPYTTGPFPKNQTAVNKNGDTVLISDWVSWGSKTGDSWNGINDINFYISAGGSTPPDITIGIDGLTFIGLAASYLTVKDYVIGGPQPYAINMNYIWKDTDVNDEMPYLNFIWEPATKCLKDICNLMAGVRYANGNQAGIHWIVWTDGSVMMAPVDDHNVNGYNGSPLFNISTYWALDSGLTLTVGEDIIKQNFEQKEPLCNFILCNAVYQNPIYSSTLQTNEWCNGDNWLSFSSTIDEISHSGDAIIGPKSITFSKVSGSGIPLVTGATDKLYINLNKDELHPTDPFYNELIETNLLIDPQLSFWVKCNNLNQIEVRVYTDLAGTFNNGEDDGFGNYFYQNTINLSGNNGGWSKVDLLLGYKGNWHMNNAPTWSKWIKRIEFRVVGGTNDGYFYLDGLNVNASHIRGAWDSTKIANMGGLKYRLINEVLFAGSNLITIGSNPDQLDYLLIGELRRDEASPWIGQVTIPLAPQLLGGQRVTLAPLAGQSFPVGFPTTFRILKLQHAVSTPTGSLTHLWLTSDLLNSYTTDYTNLETQAIKQIDPLFQTRDFARLKIAGILPKSNPAKIIDISTL